MNTRWLNFSRAVNCAVGLLTGATVLGQDSLFDPAFEVGPGADGLVLSVAVQGDGQLVLGGTFQKFGEQASSYLARLNSNGHLDDSFGSGTDGTVFRIVAQPDGKLLIGGRFNSLQGVERRGIGRLLTNGVVDMDFNAGDVLGSNHMATAVAMQPDGKIFVGTDIDAANNSSLVRLLPDGDLDASFVQTNQFQDWNLFAVQSLSDGSLLVGGGFSSVNGFPSPGLALLHSNGVVNTNFTSPLANLSTVFSLVQQTSGSLLVGGLLRRPGETGNKVLGRLNANLSWDTNFTTDSFEPVPTWGSYARSVVVQPDNKILVGGFFEVVGGYSRRHVVRLDSQGQVDPCFDPGLGFAPVYAAGVMQLARQPDGRVVVGGDFSQFATCPANIARLLPAGECGVTRAHLVQVSEGVYAALATCAPGGVNFLQVSTNLVDWDTVSMGFQPYLYSGRLNFSDTPQAFFRVRKDY